jgi:hypothetical protein|tara:strand:- start:425 stop:1003 length:579 start_codon:yes stop_codon:yes gene_type:complete
MPITKLQFRPGINKETTSYSNKGGWNDCDLVRFRFGYPEKLGGWEKYSINSFLGSSRSLHSWANLQGNKYLSLGTEIKFYIEESQGYNDITPLRRKVVSGVTVFDLNGLTIIAKSSGSAGTGQIGAVIVLGSQDVPVLARNPNSGVLSIGIGQIGTATIDIPPTAISLTGTTALGSVTVSITNESTVIVGGS